MDVAVRMLGPPAIRVDGSWTSLRPTKPNALLAFLAYRCERVRRGELEALLWSEADAVHAQADLRQALANLVRRPYGVCVQRDRVSAWVNAASDVSAFRRAVSEQRVADAVALYAGPLLHGFEIDDADEFASWLASERAALAEEWRRACRAVVRNEVRAGRFEEAVVVADALRTFDPLDEWATREAMRALAAVGDLRGAARRYEALSGHLRDEIGSTPEAATTALLQRLRDQAALDRAALPPWALLAPSVGTRHAVIGRERAIAEVVTLFERDHVRLVTLLGPGGIGKSTLAGAVVEALAPTLEDGVIVVSCEGVAVGDAIAVAVANAAGVRLQPGPRPGAQLASALGGRHALLVLDGFEAHLAEVGTVGGLVAGAEQLRVLVTSRVRLRLSTETVVEVAPLATRTTANGRVVAPAARAWSPSPAAQLFLRVALRRVSAEAVRAFDPDTVERIADAVDGHPLALELAASWVDVHGLAGLEVQLRRSWDALSSDEIDRPVRRRDVRAGIAEAWEQLDDVDRAAWARLAVMPGSLQREVAAAVGGSGWGGLRRLGDRAVVRQRAERLELHALLGRYGRERAVAEGLEDLAWAAALREWRERIARDVDPRSGRRLRVHPHDLEQALAAWRWASLRQEWQALAEMAVGLTRALGQAMRWHDRQRLVTEALALLAAATGPGRDAAWARLLPLSTDVEVDSVARLADAAASATSHGDDVALALNHAVLALRAPPAERARHAEAAREAYLRTGDRVGLASLLHEWGWWSAQIGRFDVATTVLREAFGAYEALADEGGLADVHDSLARLAVLRGELGAAREHVQAARGLCAASGTVLRDADTFATEAWAAWVAGDRTRAAACIEAFTERAGRIDDPLMLTFALWVGYHHRFGPPEEALARATRLLRWGGEALRFTALGTRTVLVAAVSSARVGEIDGALGYLADGLPLVRAMAAPRFVAHVVLAAAAVAAALDRQDEARRWASSARQHPALEFEFRLEAAALLGETGPPSRLGVVGDQALLDEALLDEVEGALAAWREARVSRS
ncbi:MAG: hypothetical protein EA416_12515 [Trueperaceae bacterium]|nr:MAG: hypothetical protein EA416_12515 [Trueperaceae bacterium]